MSYIQNRKGPKKVRFIGLLQPVTDGIKLLLKKFIYPVNRREKFFFYSPIFAFLLMLFKWFVFRVWLNHQFIVILRIIIFFCFRRMKVFTLLGSGWGRNSKYSLLGSLRGRIQVISYEVALLTLKFLPCCFQSSYKFLSFFKKVRIYILFLLPIFILWIIRMVRETNRAPFDFAEGERELVSGFKVEYGSFSFALLFLAEYGRIILVSFIRRLFFLPKVVFINVVLGKIICFFFIVFRGSFPRWRIDFLMNLGWKIILPIGFFFTFFLLT